MKPPRALPILSLALFAAAAQGEILERVIVKVNGDIVTQSEFEARQIAAVQQARIPAEQIEKYLRDNNAHILQEAIDDLLLVQRAADIGLKMRPEYIKEVLEGIKKENKIESDEELQNQLKREGMTLEELKRNIERNMLKRQVLQRDLESKIAVSENDIKAWYDAHMEDYTKAPTVHLQEIDVRDDTSNPSLARDLVARARGGEDFTELARTYSVGPNKASGGDLGVLRKGDLAPDVEKVAFALAPGQVSDPLPTKDGFRILKVVERTEGSVVPYEDTRAEIQRRLNQTRSSEEIERYLEGLRQKAIVDLRVREVPLQLSQPAPTGGTRLEPSADALAPVDAPAPAATPASPDEEISTSPQARPERVAPPEAAAPAPAPSPTPTPTPPPS
jgi:peptidyl-prolyl cis-trans isomerase SurA